MKALIKTAALVAALGLAACASTPEVTEFPANARTPDAAELQTLLRGQSFTLEPSNGVRVDYANGPGVTAYFSGRSAQGQWRTQDGAVCIEFTTIPSACNQVRVVAADLYLKRDSGEVVRLAPR